MSAMKEGTPAGTNGTGNPFEHGDSTSISFIGFKGSGKRTLVQELAKLKDVDTKAMADIEQINQTLFKNFY